MLDSKLRLRGDDRVSNRGLNEMIIILNWMIAFFEVIADRTARFIENNSGLE